MQTAAVVAGIVRDAAADHGEPAAAGSAHAAAQIVGVARDVAVPEGAGAAAVNKNAKTFFAGIMRDLAARLTIGDGKASAAVDADGIAAVFPGDGLAVETKVHAVIVARPGIGQGDVLLEIIVTLSLDFGQSGNPFPLAHIAVLRVVALGLAAETVIGVESELQAALTVAHQVIARVVAEKTGGVRRAVHDGFAERGRDADARGSIQAVAHDGDGSISVQIDIPDTVVGDSRRAGKVQCPEVVHTADAVVAGGGVVGYLAAIHVEGRRRTVIHTAAAVFAGGGVVGDFAAVHVEGGGIVCYAFAVEYAAASVCIGFRVVPDSAAVHIEGSAVEHAETGVVAGDGAVPKVNAGEVINDNARMLGIIICNAARDIAIGYGEVPAIQNGRISGVPLLAVPASDGIAVQAERDVFRWHPPPFINLDALRQIIVAGCFDFAQRGDPNPCQLFTVGCVAAAALAADTVRVHGGSRRGKDARRHKPQYHHKG